MFRHKKKKITLTVEVICQNDYQHVLTGKKLTAIMGAIEKEVGDQHRKNKFSINLEGYADEDFKEIENGN